MIRLTLLKSGKDLEEIGPSISHLRYGNDLVILLFCDFSALGPNKSYFNTCKTQFAHLSGFAKLKNYN